ncbi:MAG: hypothetical protein DIU71_02725 [Proteobacteria bacterium]|nr:MAG: hypothetical protein DIU71_02725 [Pseudomonadota bacterium]
MLLLLGATGASSQSAHELIAQCSRAADGGSVGLEALEVDCPGLEHALVELQLAPFITEQQAERLNVHALDDIAALTRHFTAAPPATPSMDTAMLEAILAELQLESTVRPPSWLERVRQWLQGLLDRWQSQEYAWLQHWLEEKKLLEGLGDALDLGSLVVVLALMVLVVRDELRAAGWLRGRGRGRRPANAAAVARRDVASGSDDMSRVPLEQRPAMLLRWLVAALQRAGRLQGDRSLTHRELTLRAGFAQPEQREAFGQVAMLAERLLYAAERVPADEIDRVLQEGIALHAQLCAQRGAGA